MKPKIGLVGTGQTVGIAHYHVVGLLADGRTELAAVYSLDSDGAARFLREHGLENARICASYAELLDCVDAVDICTPNHTHIEYVLSAIEAGKAILVEKPLALSAADSRRAVEALQTKNVFNMVGFVLRYAFVIQELRKLVRNDLGRVYSFQGSYGGSRLANPTIPVEWRMLHKYSGSGALGDFGSHLIDLAYFTAGLTFESVSGMTATVIPNRPANSEGITQVENDDLAAFIARTTDDALATFTVSRVGMDELKLLVVGENGLARVNLAAPDEIYYLPAQKGIYSSDPKVIKVAHQKPFEGWFVTQMRAFSDGLTGEQIDVPDVFQGHYVETVLEAAAKACAAQAVRVELAGNQLTNNAC